MIYLIKYFIQCLDKKIKKIFFKNNFSLYHLYKLNKINQ